MNTNFNNILQNMNVQDFEDLAKVVDVPSHDVYMELLKQILNNNYIDTNVSCENDILYFSSADKLYMEVRSAVKKAFVEYLHQLDVKDNDIR